MLFDQSNDDGFYIDKTTGVIYVKKILDREIQNRFVLHTGLPIRICIMKKVLSGSGLDILI